MTMMAIPVALDDARAWLRLGAAGDDAIVERLVRAATNICEAFTGQWLVIRAGEERVAVRGGIAALRARPVIGIDEAALIAADGSEMALDPDKYRTVIGPDGDAAIRIDDPQGAGQVRIGFRAGIAAAAENVPEAIRHGILRMTQHLYAARDDVQASPPAAIAALWQPWRRIGLGGAR
ncbi:hypothetical protein K5P26_00670 [Sphingopyxis sp. XHP0097]|uniref:PhiE125 gp8 family phage protein n=1 Tax=Sphingopyxis jiangsuensis TaxID=2871171 RepID=A0ABS7M9F8_9SPHN|nr:hypothetical protein [Sphingopyxis jiangsuensis]MBY4635647.1 hypothetical protein [Sphingopyxis jiangsuensis]